MSDLTRKWTACDIWLGNHLVRGGVYAANVVRDGEAAGFSRQQLAASYAALQVQTTGVECNIWAIDSAKTGYWLNHALLQLGEQGVVVEQQAPTFTAGEMMAAVACERSRIEAIICAPPAQARTEQARRLAFRTNTE